jgi:RimJ/RimL family protein N-acetyltransferase
MSTGQFEAPIETPRLRLRPLTLEDVDTIHRLADDPEVAAGLSDLPHPYPREAAAGLVHGMSQAAAAGSAYAFGIELNTPAPPDTVIGIVFLIPDPEHRRAELIYWLGRPYWGSGYATEAVRAMLRFGFESLGLNRIHASFFTQNPASARVMEKAGMRFEGVMRGHHVKRGEALDLGSYGILRADTPAP